ncbi:MAG: GNAT family N-acetyltransferase [Firmicutes bacterium]|nr:GNAT family N-acetyltransferase [Bacillota bacterium]
MYRDIDDENQKDDIRLREGNTYFYSVVEGMEIHEPDEAHPYPYCQQDEMEIRKDRYLLPKGMPAESKLYFGVFDDDERYLAADDIESTQKPEPRFGRCLAIVDLVMGYPTEEYVYIGWFILENEVHGVGLAANIMDVLYSVSRKLGYKYIKLSAYDVNEPGMKFWRKQGFKEDGFVMRTTGKGELKLNKFIKEL